MYYTERIILDQFHKDHIGFDKNGEPTMEEMNSTKTAKIIRDVVFCSNDEAYQRLLKDVLSGVEGSISYVLGEAHRGTYINNTSNNVQLYLQAITHYQNAIKNGFQCYRELGECYFLLQDFKNVEEAFMKTTIENGRVNALLKLASIYLGNFNLNSAKKTKETIYVLKEIISILEKEGVNHS